MARKDILDPSDGGPVAVPVENKVPEEQPLPVFWDGAPGTLQVGMVCRQGKMSVQVLQVIPCVNGTIILGASVLDGRSQMVHVSEPLAHPLSGRDAATPEQRDFIRKLWEYDQQ